VTTIIGIDAATEAKKLGLARGRVEGDRLVVSEVVLGSEVGSVTDTIASWVAADTLIAIDAPLGWPLPLGQALREHRAGVVIEANAHDLFRRVTDRFVHETLRKPPLEVGADRIARTAHMALRRLSELRRATRLDIPLAWAPGVQGVACIEVYPAATLKARGIDPSGCKGKKDGTAAHRRRVLEAVRDELHLGFEDGRLVGSDDRLDAVLCVLAGVDFLRGQCIAPDDCQRERAEVEGWIWFRDPNTARPR
jgi:predicted nuclease with RNAse H fold